MRVSNKWLHALPDKIMSPTSHDGTGAEQTDTDEEKKLGLGSRAKGRFLLAAPDSLWSLLITASAPDTHQSVSLRKAQNSRRQLDWLTGCCTCSAHVSCAGIPVPTTFPSSRGLWRFAVAGMVSANSANFMG